MILYRNRYIFIRDNLYVVSGKPFPTLYLAKLAVDLSFINLEKSIKKIYV